jgi:uracil-DNA glycosylase
MAQVPLDMSASDRPEQLISADPTAWPVAPGWRAVTDGFFASDAGQQLLDFLRSRLAAGAVVFPPQPLRALELTPPEQVRVVILGQDPYHGRGQAEGLAFSVASGVALPPSLRNIFKELQRDLGRPPPPFPVPGGSLERWATHGVLLLNTCLTVEEGRPASHAGRGWELLTDSVIRQVSAGEHAVGRPCAEQARVDRYQSPPGVAGQPSVAAVGAASAFALYWLWAFLAGSAMARWAS